MKVLLINPNSDKDMTENLKKLVKNYRYENISVNVRGAVSTPKFIDSKEAIDSTYNELCEIIEEENYNYDIFIIGCHLDPNLEKLRKKTDKIVMGICEVSVLFAKMLGKRFSVVGSSSKTVNLKENLVKNYGALDLLDEVGYPKEDKGNLADSLYNASKEIVSEKDSDSIILGCAGFVNMDAYIQNKLGRDVIDGVAVALLIADIYAKYEKVKNNLNLEE